MAEEDKKTQNMHPCPSGHILQDPLSRVFKFPTQGLLAHILKVGDQTPSLLFTDLCTFFCKNLPSQSRHFFRQFLVGLKAVTANFFAFIMYACTWPKTGVSSATYLAQFLYQCLWCSTSLNL